MHAEQWAAVGQVGAFLVAIAALVFALVSRKNSKKAIHQAERSATAAEASARAAEETVIQAERANELTATEMRDRATSRADQDFKQASLLRGRITWVWGNSIPNTGRFLARQLRTGIENHSNHPALNVRYRHPDHAPDFRPLASVVPAGRTAEVMLDFAEPIEVNEDHSDLIAGTEITYVLDGTSWIRRGDDSPPEPLTTERWEAAGSEI